MESMQHILSHYCYSTMSLPLAVVYLSFSVLVFIFVFFLTKIIGRNITKQKTRWPLGPKKLPIIGNLHLLGELPHRALKRLSDKYGDLMFLQLGTIPTLVVSSADSAREIFKNNDLAFSGRPVLYTFKRLTYNSSNIAFAQYGEYWRELRKILILELLSPKMVRSFGSIRLKEVSNTMNCIIKSSQTKNSVINLSELIILLANTVVCRVAFGRNRDENMDRKFLGILYERQQLLGRGSISDFFPWLEWVNKVNGLDKRLEKNVKDLDEFFDEVIDDHLVKSRELDYQLEYVEDDVVDVLVRLQRDPTQAITLTNDHIRGVLTDIFVAGSETSSATIIWTMSELIRNPQCMKKAQNEIRQVMNGKPIIEESDLLKLNYLKMVIKESLRMHPPVPLLIPKETIQNSTVQGYEIPAKTRVFINAIAISMDAKYWKNPTEFEPERFLENLIDFRGKHFELIPFGAGRRGCPGINFAISMVEHALANLLYHFDWKLPNEMQIDELDMEDALGLTTHKKIPLCLQAFPILR